MSSSDCRGKQTDVASTKKRCRGRREWLHQLLLVGRGTAKPRLVGCCGINMGCAWHNMAGVLRWVTLITPLFMVHFALGFNLKPKTRRGSSALAPKALSETGIAKTSRGSLLQPPGASPSPPARRNPTLLVTTPLHYWCAALNLTFWGLPKPSVSALFGAESYYLFLHP